MEKYALGDYMHALSQGAALPQAEKQQVAQKLHGHTGLPDAFYESGHMVYVRVPVLKELQDNVAKFIEATGNLGK